LVRAGLPVRAPSAGFEALSVIALSPPVSGTEKYPDIGVEPSTRSPTSEEPTFEEPTFEEPTPEEPTSEEPTSEEPTPEELDRASKASFAGAGNGASSGRGEPRLREKSSRGARPVRSRRARLGLGLVLHS
jgi:hypothetical protein